jgi:sulfatase modifying factor 1
LYRADYYTQLTAAGKVARNPQGPDTSLDPSEPGVQKRVQRGGSFLCTSQYCSRYILGIRGKGEESSATNHIGFRCVRNPAATLPATAHTGTIDIKDLPPGQHKITIDLVDGNHELFAG